MGSWKFGFRFLFLPSGEANMGAMVSHDTPKKKYAQKKRLMYIKDEAEQIRYTQLAQWQSL